MKKISDFNSATEKYPVVYAGSATRPEFVDMPTTLQQQEGVAPMDTLPAQWWNAMWKLATKDINAFRDYVGNAFTEINNLLTKFNIALDDADSEQLYDFFHDDYVQNYLSTIFVNKTGDTIDGDLHIKGDLSVDGIGEEIISTELKVGANTITLRNDNPTALGNTELAGVVTENYDGNNHNNIIAIDKNGEARTGDIDIATRILYSNDGTNFYTDEDLTIPATIGATEEVRDTGNQTSGGVEIYEGITYSNDDTQPLLTRAEENELPNGVSLVWDAQNKRAIAGSSSGVSVIITSTTSVNNIPLTNNADLRIMFTSDVMDSNSPSGVTPLAITYNNVSIPVKANKDGSLVDVLANEVEAGVWKYLQAYTTLELVYQSDYDGQGNFAFIIIGNPVLLSSTNYTIYANGKESDILEQGKIPGREQYDDSYYIKYSNGIIEEWWVQSAVLPSMSGSPIASSHFTATFPIPLKSGTVSLQFDVHMQNVIGTSATLWFGSSNGASDSNTKQSVECFSTYPYSSSALQGNVKFHVVGFWK